MNKKYFFLVIVFNLFIAVAFYLNSSKAEITEISGDLANIIPICKKLDNPNLYKNDLYLGNINNVKYYTPFYVESLRFIASFTNYDYVRALNILSLTTHFFYGILWFYFFFLIRKDFWLAFGFSIFMRGIIWSPGHELLGISDLWSIMPRTLFIVLIPLPFIIYKLTNQKIVAASIILGLLVNFHPISGIGAIIIYISLLMSYYYVKNDFFLLNRLKEISLISMGVFLGMIPYFITYISNIKSTIIVDQNIFDSAIHARIEDIFFNGLLFLKGWNLPFTYFFGIIFILFFFIDTSLRKINSKIIFISILILLIFANSIPFLEKQINHLFHLNFRIAFQLIRSQKLIIVLLQVAMYLFLFEIINKHKIQNKIKIFAIILYLFILSVSSAPFLKGFPLLGDDISTMIFPNNLKIYTIKKNDNNSIIEVFDYVNHYTNSEDLFYCRNVHFRAATGRSEVLDFHASGMLIEGNPNDFVKVYSEITFFNQCKLEQKIEMLKNKKVNFIIDNQKWKGLKPVFKNKEYYIYKL